MELAKPKFSDRDSSMPKKGGRKPSARKMQSQAALSRVVVKQGPDAWTAPSAPKKIDVLDGIAEAELEPTPEPEPELGAGCARATSAIEPMS